MGLPEMVEVRRVPTLNPGAGTRELVGVCVTNMKDWRSAPLALRDFSPPTACRQGEAVEQGLKRESAPGNTQKEAGPFPSVVST